MRLSSVSVIAVALAAIAGSALAAPGPGPLHARALEDVNSRIERDVDVYIRESGLLLERELDGEFVDDLVTRTQGGYRNGVPLHEGFRKACQANYEAARTHGTATDKAMEAYIETGNNFFKSAYRKNRDKKYHHIKKAEQDRETQVAFRDGHATEEQRVNPHQKWKNSQRAAGRSRDKADKMIRLANEATQSARAQHAAEGRAKRAEAVRAENAEYEISVMRGHSRQ